MPDIMSAEELDEYTSEVKFNSDGNVWFAVHGRDDRVKVIRSRDSAMLEKYKDAIATLYSGHGEDMLPSWVVIKALDSAFAEIEGGK